MADEAADTGAHQPGLRAYKVLLSDASAVSFSLAGLLARMPLSMTGISTVFLVTAYTRSFALAGLLTAVSTVTAAVSAPWWGRAVDRVGQARVLITAGVLCNSSLVLVIVAVTQRLPVALALLAAAGAGLGFTSAGSCVRSRWAHRVGGSSLLQTAYAWEAVVDELIYVVGPVLAVSAATIIHPSAGLAVCVITGFLGALALALNRASEPPVPARMGSARTTARLSPRVLAPVVAACVSLGALFGGMELVVVACAGAFGAPGFAGIMLALWATSSLVAGLITGALAWRVSPTRRFRRWAFVLAATVLPLPLLDSPGSVAVCLLAGGAAVSPTLIASVAVVQARISPARLNEAFGWTTMGMAGGVALGAAALGLLVDAGGYRAGFLGLVAVSALIAAAAAFVRSPSRERA